MVIDMKKITYGILSTASIVGRFIQGVRDSKNGDVRAICSRNIHKARQKAREFMIDKAYDDYAQMLADEDLDAIYIATPNALHYPNALQAIRAKKHVVLEKPFVLTKEQAIHLFEEAKANNVFIMEAQKIVFLPITNHIKKIIQEKTLGELHYVNMTSSFVARFGYEHWMYDLQYGGGCLYGSCTYSVEYLMYLLDSLDVKCQGLQLTAPTGVDDFCQLQFTVADKVMVSSCISMRVLTKNVANFYFENGYIEVENYWKARSMKIVKDGKEEMIEYPCPCEFVYEVDHINECIARKLNASDIMIPEMTIKTCEVVDSVFASWNPDVIRDYAKCEE